ncbi:hypothetical protein CONCODRAFT_85104 [Conidiobolus coronatus NRRL 28638]|uniref:Uncharacterized protein n=1 Tax=Conidiobolus coronatus (strain ATCC 28846 / CBS 209.66 / NRRL 28638) TaxID=796925 RepID=A0A137P6Y0_CONC2|nr:hypothetical protein CONCODRAFT_85104 [Conidiobolus coronatus NRRL 28638]|eukprot:KXN70729.1 hypothetical protein CONCODRAFT_85104 [Conidiobolus coronatus NRRL 28638]
MTGFLLNEAYKKLSEYSIHLPYNYYSKAIQKLNLSAIAKETGETSPEEERLTSNLVSYNNHLIAELNYLRLTQNQEDLISQLILNTLRTHNSSSTPSEFNYNSEVIKYIQYLSELNINTIQFDIKYDALFTISKKLGNSCLLLDTPSSRGFFEIVGILKVLEEYDQVPKTIVGEEFWGSLSAALCCVMKAEKVEELTLECNRGEGLDFDELISFSYNNNDRSIFSYLYNPTNTQKLYSTAFSSNLSKFLQLTLNNLTFYDIYLKFGKILNLLIHPSKSNYSPILFNYLSTPNVLVKSVVFRLYAIDVELEDEEALVVEKDPHSGDLIPFNLIYEKLINNSLSSNYLSNKLGQLFNINYIINCKEENFTIRSNLDISSRANFAWVNKFVEFCKDEMVAKLRQLNQLKLLPTLIQKALQANDFSGKLVTKIEVKNLPEMHNKKLSTLDKLKLIKSGSSSAKSKVEEICNYREIEVEIGRILKSMRDEVRDGMTEMIKRKTIKDIREGFRSRNRLSTIGSGSRATGDEGKFNNRRNQTI